MHLHLQDTIVILEEVNQPHPHLPSCDMFIIWVVMKNHQPNNRALHVGGRKEATTAGRGGGTVRGGNGVPIVRTATENSDILQLPWITSYCNNKWLAIIRRQPTEGMEELVSPFQYFGEGGIIY